MNERQKRKQKRYEKRLTKLRQVIPPKAVLPSIDKPASEYTEAEKYGMAIHPAFTGMGVHYATVSDEDWVAAVIEESYRYQPNFVLACIIDLMNDTPERWMIGQQGGQEVENVRPPVLFGDELPDPRVEPISGHKPATAGMLRSFIMNPVYVGIVPYRRLIHPVSWLQVFLQAVRNEQKEKPFIEAYRHALVDMLALLKSAYGAPGVLAHVPFGYQVLTDPGGGQHVRIHQANASFVIKMHRSVGDRLKGRVEG